MYVQCMYIHCMYNDWKPFSMKVWELKVYLHVLILVNTVMFNNAKVKLILNSTAQRYGS